MTNDWIFSEQEICSTPSMRDGMKYMDELVLRRNACDFIEKMAKALYLPKLAQISADNFLHRFYMRQSLVRYEKYLVAAACVLLGSKVEDSPKNISYVAREYIAIRMVVEKDQMFAIQKHDPQVIASKIISMEGVVLHNLAYELTLSHPYKYINDKVDKVVRLKRLNDQEAKVQTSKIKRVAWAILNDSAYTVACLRLESIDLAADAARYLLNAYTAPYIDTDVLAAGLSKLVYIFHPPKPVESPALFVVPDVLELEHLTPTVSTPMDTAACLTSPECGSGNGRSRFDHHFDHGVKLHVKDSEESSREMAQIPSTPAWLLDSFDIVSNSSVLTNCWEGPHQCQRRATEGWSASALQMLKTRFVPEKS
ncbi:hypothetical protein PsorP6_010033 [Peronosclerospora sorghi]|uniref:Uncharacterized protein n=1 Tax=Peronosclerospora sorghi TaxID=230839 RepID=A0ACC0VZI4_9STRA|nr:hypothetical protein PsorP6_010033 [Peronosclerospora sorghi]